MSTRVQVKSSNRECVCDVNLICRLVRVFAAITNLGVGVAAGFVVAIGAEFYNATGPTTFCNFVENERLGIFLGIIGVFYCIFALLGFLGEMRFDILRRTVLKPFGVLLTYVGRGCTYMLLGTIFCALPMEKSKQVVTLVPGGVLVGVGLVELMLGLLVKKERNVVITKSAAATTKTEAAKIRWGEPEGAGAGTDDSSSSAPSGGDAESGNYASASSFSAAGGSDVAATPSKKGLMGDAASTPRTPPSGSRKSVVTQNPFRQASGKAV